MSAGIGNIVKQLKNYNEQSSFKEKDVVLSELPKVNWKLAYCINSFLVGSINGLPKFEYINEVVNEYDALTQLNLSRKYISSCGGTVVSFDNGVLVIESTEEINKNKTRCDLISCHEYEAYIIVYSNFNSKVVEIDTKEKPKFEEGRIKFLQNYLKEYMEFYNKKPKTK